MSQALSLWQFSELLIIILNLDFMIIRMSELDSENGHSDLTLYHVGYFPSHLHAVKAGWEAPQIFKGEEDKNKFSLTSHSS